MALQVRDHCLCGGDQNGSKNVMWPETDKMYEKHQKLPKCHRAAGI